MVVYIFTRINGVKKFQAVWINKKQTGVINEKSN